MVLNTMTDRRSRVDLSYLYIVKYLTYIIELTQTGYLLRLGVRVSSIYTLIPLYPCPNPLSFVFMRKSDLSYMSMAFSRKSFRITI